MNDTQQSGFLLIDKPAEWTSFDVVAKLRSITGIRKIGHAGTLDPFATGLLIVAIGRSATKQIDVFVKKEKRYDATFELGKTSSTQDTEGKITDNHITDFPSRKKVQESLNTFIGTIHQVPPMHSAIKINGKKLYELARQGKEIERPPRKITIHELDIVGYKAPTLKLTMSVGSGTYVRALARDIGEKLGTGAYTTVLRRTSIGHFKIEDAHKIENITPDNWTRCLIAND